MRTSLRNTLLFVALGASVAVLRAQDPPQEPPVFRGDVDVIRLDVSVLDRDRRPVRDLTAADFIIEEDGKRQTVVGVSEILAEERDPRPTAWMRFASRDVTMNSLADQLGEGRLFAIIIDDWNLPEDDVEITMAARAAARRAVENMGPSDLAAIIFTQDPGRMQEFTDDRAKLLAAIDRYDPHPRPYVGPTPRSTSGAGDMPTRYSPAVGFSQCFRSQPAVPTLSTVIGRLTTVPDRRKTLLFISTGVPMAFDARGGCAASLADEMRNAFRKAERGNVNVHGIDPAGYKGYEEYYFEQTRRFGRGGRGENVGVTPPPVRSRKDFLKTIAENTGGRAVVDTDEVEPKIDQIFEEDGSYYLVGYQSSNGAPDGKFRKVEVRVNRPGATVLTRSGYWALKDGTLATPERRDAPDRITLGLAGMMDANPLPLRATATPVGPAANGKDVDVAVVLTVRLPQSRVPVNETATIIRTVYDEEGRQGPPSREIHTLEVAPSVDDVLRYDVHSLIAMPPGRRQIRLNVQSKALDRNGTIYVDVEVPDLKLSTLALSPLVLGSNGDAAVAAAGGGLAELLPLTPTTARDFASGETLKMFVRLFQVRSDISVDALVKTQVFDRYDQEVFTKTETLAADAFGTSKRADYLLDVPLSGMTGGPHLLSVTASLPGGRSTRRDLVFRVR